jgi:hypothetical protein
MIIILSALAVMAAPAAAVAKPSKADRREAQKECRAERGDTDATREAFNEKYRNFGDCVSQNAREAAAERKAARKAAARECREEGNESDKCVSRKAKAERAEQDAEDAEEAEEQKNAAKECDTERGETAESRKAFEDKYGTNANKRNAFGKCVSQKAREADEDDES